MTHQARVSRPAHAEDADWVLALVAQCGGQPVPAALTDALHARLATIPLIALLTGIEALAASDDRRLAIQLYTAWIHACTDPAQARYAAWFNLGAEFKRAGDGAAAASAYRHALTLRPDFHPAAANLGLQLEANGDVAGALDVWGRAIQSNEARCLLLNHRARRLEEDGRLAEAEQDLAASLATDPAQPDAIQHWVHLRQKMCRWPALTPLPGLTLAALQQDCGPLAALSLFDDAAQQTAVTARWLDRKTTVAPQRLSPADGYRHDRLRIGYLSSDFGRHAMGYLIAELFERHDRAQFSVHGYCIGREDGSDVRTRIIAAFDSFTRLSALPDDAAARAIAADEIDILVDLNGLTAGARPQILRWRPAPVQATYLGFIGSVPLPELDYLFCDSFVIPGSAVADYRPAPLPIARIYQANDTRRRIGAAVSRADAGLPADAFVFCCFANHYKITEAMFAAWMDILGRVPGAVLWLAADNQWSHAALCSHAERLGVDPARLIFAPRVDPASYIARLALADLFLDTHPYNAGTIASDALRMGLPLLTLCGHSFVARMAAGLLTAIGAPEGITHSREAYVRRAVALGTDPARYAALRARVTPAAWAASIGDIGQFTAHYEATLRQVAKAGPAAAAAAAAAAAEAAEFRVEAGSFRHSRQA